MLSGLRLSVQRISAITIDRIYLLKQTIVVQVTAGRGVL